MGNVQQNMVPKVARLTVWLALLTTFIWAVMGTRVHATPLDRQIRFAYPPVGYPPYIIAANDSEQVKGIMADIFREIAENLGYKVGFRQYPDRRSQVLLERGEIDAFAYAREWSNQPDKFDWTDPILDIADNLIFASGRNIENPTFEALRGKSVGTMTAYVYPSFETAFNNRVIKRTDAPEFQNLFLMLQSGRVDAILLDEFVAGWHFLQSPDLHPNDFVINDHPFDPVGFRVMMPRLQPLDWSKFIREFNAALSEWKASGQVNLLIRRYTGTQAQGMSEQ